MERNDKQLYLDNYTQHMNVALVYQYTVNLGA